MKYKCIAIGMLVSAALLVGHAWAGPQMNPGKWEITTKTEMAGMPPQSITHTQCITNDDLVPMSEDAGKECQVSDIRIEGNTAHWRIVCGGKGGQMEGTGQVTYRGDTMVGTMQMEVSGANMQITNHLTGRRIGNCDGQAAAQPAKTAEQAPQKPSAVEEAIVEDTKDVGRAAKDEAKQSTIDGVRKEVRGVFKKWFD